MHNTQTSVWEIQHPSTLYHYQALVELQGTHLEVKVDATVDILLVQGIKTMMPIRVAVVHCVSKVVGGMTGATVQTSMVPTVMDSTHLMLMV